MAEAYYNRGNTYAKLGRLEDAAAIYYSGCAFGLLAAEMQACAWLEQAILQDENYRLVAKNDPYFDGIRDAVCFKAVVGDA